MDGFRNLLYSLVMLLFITLQYYSLMNVGSWLLGHVDSYESTINDIIFWVVLFVIGFLFIFLMNLIYAFTAVNLIREITKIMPDRPYAVWFVRIYSIIFCGILIIKEFNSLDSARMIFVFFVMATIAMRVAYINITATNESLLVKKVIDGSNITEKELRAQLKPILKGKAPQDDVVKRINERLTELNREDNEEL